jgi:hypothetical protein
MFLDYLRSNSAASYRFHGRLLCAIFLAAAFFLIWQGPAPITGPWDVMALLDGAWRIVSGQVPHTDYHNPIGPLTELAIAFGMKIGVRSTLAIVIGSVLLLAVLLPWFWRIASRRLPAALAFASVLFAGVLLVSPRPLGYAIRDTTYAMLYNRQGYVLLSMLLIGVFIPRRAPPGDGSAIDGFSIGLLSGLLLYCKITYFAIAAASLLLAPILIRRSKPWFLAATAGFVAVCAAFFLLFHINPHSYLADIATAGRSQATGMRLGLLRHAAQNNFLWIYLLFVCTGSCAWAGLRPGKPWLGLISPWLKTAWIVAAALGIESGNTAQGAGIEDPLFFVAGVIAIESLCRGSSEPGPRPASRLALGVGVLLTLPIFGGTIFARDLASLAYAAKWNLIDRPLFPEDRRIHSAPLRDFLVPASTGHITSYWPAREYPARMNEGLDLLHKHLEKGDRIATIGLTNPFSFALGLAPARDGNQWWDLDISFNRHNHPTPIDFLGDATLVMVPRPIPGVRGWGFDTVAIMLDLYGGYLRANFEPVDSSEAWTLYRRR